MIEGLVIRKAEASDSDRLTEISFRSKQYWNYPDEYFQIWKQELTIAPSYISDNIVNLAEISNEVIGYYSISNVENDFRAGDVLVTRGFWLEHIFILPEFIGKGIGTELIKHARMVCADIGCSELKIFADPYSSGFYDKIGGQYVGDYPSSIEGRTVCLYRLPI